MHIHVTHQNSLLFNICYILFPSLSLSPSEYVCVSICPPNHKLKTDPFENIKTHETLPPNIWQGIFLNKILYNYHTQEI